MPSFDFYKRSSLRCNTDKRMIKMATVSDDFVYVIPVDGITAPPFDNTFYYAFTGCAPSAVIGEF